jgi:hypothetical protein
MERKIQMTDRDAVGVRAAIDAGHDAWTFDEQSWSIEKFERILDKDAMVIDDYGGQLSLLYGHKDRKTIWDDMVKE